MLDFNGIIQRINDVRSAPDALMAGVNYSFDLSLFHRNDEASPKWTASSSGNGIKFSLADAALVAAIVIAGLTLACFIATLCFKIMYRKRFR